jgi:hypothetical protein
MTNATSPAAGTTLWIALVAALSVFGSFAYACAAPVAAVAALAALTLNRTEGLILVAATWAINQAVGFVLLSYPHDAGTYAWGAAIGAAMIFGYIAARPVARAGQHWLVAAVATFAAAIVFYQLGLYGGSLAMGYTGDAFSTPVVQEVAAINAVAFVGFLAVYRAAVALSLVKPAEAAAPITA